MTRSAVAPFLLLLLAAGSPAQQDAALEFEAASVKPGHTDTIAGPNGARAFTYWGCSGGPGWSDPIRYTCTGVGLRHLIETAWGLKDYQLIAPDALDGPTYDVAAKLPPGATRSQFQLMLQKLLIDRFHLVVHHEMRVQPVYILTIAKDGHKLQVPPPGDKETWSEALDNNPNGDGKAKHEDPPEVAARREQFRQQLAQFNKDRPTRTDMPSGPAPIGLRITNGITRLAGRRATMAGLAAALSSQVDCPVLDQTGLAGEWNFIVEYGSTSPPALSAISRLPAANSQGSATEPVAPSGGPSISTAFLKQLGLELKAAKEPADKLVVDKFDKTPVAN